MRILQVHTSYREAGGEDVVVGNEAALLRRRGHEVTEHVRPNPAATLASGLALALSPWNPRSAAAIRRLTAEVRPDVAHVHNTWFAMSPAVVRALQASAVPVVMTLHNYRLICSGGQLRRDGDACEICVGSRPWPGVRHRCYRDSRIMSLPAAATIALNERLGTWSDGVDLFLALNEFSVERFVRGGLPADRIRVKSNFVADPGDRSQPAAASSTVLYAGRISSEKGVDVLIDAWHRLGDTSLDLVIVGDGPLRIELEGRALPGIEFTGRLAPDEVRRRMLSARALVLPSLWYEGQPMVALEALAAGLPVLSSEIGGLPELLGPLGPRWLVPPGRIDAWHAALAGLSDDADVERASRLARAEFEQRFCEEVAGLALEEGYAAAVARHAGRPPT